MPVLLLVLVVLLPEVGGEKETVEDEDTDEEVDSVDCEGEGEHELLLVVVTLVVSTLLLVDDVLLAADNAVRFGCILLHEREEF